MQRRRFIFRASIALAIGGTGFSLAGSSLLSAQHLAVASANLARRRRIDASVNDLLERLYRTIPGARELIHKAYGVLVFPSIFQTSSKSFSFRGLRYFRSGQQYGEGALRAHGSTLGYYSTASRMQDSAKSGAHSDAMISLFMTQDALDSFRYADGWSVRDDALVRAGGGAVAGTAASATVAGASDAALAISPVKVSVLTSSGLMDGLSLSGTKVARLKI